MNTSYNFLRKDKTDGASTKAPDETSAVIDLYWDSDRQSHDYDKYIPLAAFHKLKEYVDEFIAS